MRSSLIVLTVLVVALWGFVGYRCYRISVMPAENDQDAGNALNTAINSVQWNRVLLICFDRTFRCRERSLLVPVMA